MASVQTTPAAPVPVWYFRDRADVYIENQTTGRRSILVRHNLPCRLMHMDPAQVGGNRDSYAGRRILAWPDSYEMPVFCDLVIGGARWTPVQGTFGRYLLAEGAPSRRTCDVMEQIDYQG